MARATVTLTPNAFPGGTENTQHLVTIRGTCKISASPDFYTAGGLALSFQSSLNASSMKDLIRVQGIYATPIQVTFFSCASSYYGSSGTYVGGFPYLWNKANNTLQIMASAGGSQTEGSGPVWQEMSDATAIPAQVSADTILFEAVFVRSYS